MNGNFPVRTYRTSWSLQYQMLLPLLALVSWIVFRQITSMSLSATDRLDENESQIPHLMAKQLPVDWELVTNAKLRDVVSQYPGWHLVMTRAEAVSHSTVALDPWNQTFLVQLPPITFSGDRARDFVIYDEFDTFWVAPLQMSAWPEKVRLIALHSRYSATQADELLESRIENLGGLMVGSLIVLGIWYSRRLGRRVIRIHQQIRHIAGGDLASRIEDHGHDEVNDLAQAVNSMADELVAMKTRIQGSERNRLHSQLSSGIAHELRNGIHSARLSLEMLQDRCQRKKVSIPESELLSISMEQLSITESLVRRLLAIGKPQHTIRTSQSVSQLLGEVQALTAPIFQHADVSVQLELLTRETGVVDDAEAIQAALLNLCLNAIEAAGQGGQVRIVVASSGRVLRITVSDNGPGLAASVSSNLFEPFVTTKSEGIGLGLVLVKQAVTAEGGSVDWTREDGWTSFTISLPIIDRVASASTGSFSGRNPAAILSPDASAGLTTPEASWPAF